jgi:hypothetical protein
MPSRKSKQKGKGPPNYNPFSAFYDGGFKKKVAEWTNLHGKPTRVEALLDAVRETFLQYESDHYHMDRRDPPSRTKIEKVENLAIQLKREISDLGDVAVKELKALGFDRPIDMVGTSTDEFFFPDADFGVAKNFPNTMERLAIISVVCEQWLEQNKARKNQARMTEFAARRVYANLFNDFRRFSAWKLGSDDCETEVDFINKAAEFADRILTAVKFRHPKLGKVVLGRLYDGAFGKMATDHLRGKDIVKKA